MKFNLKKIMVVVGIILLIIFTAIGINILAQNRKNSNNQNKDNLNEESSNYYIVGDAIYEKKLEEYKQAIQ